MGTKQWGLQPPGLANGDDGAKGGSVGMGCPSPEKNVDFRSKIGEFWCKLSAFCTVHVKLVLIAVSTVKITLGTHANCRKTNAFYAYEQ